MKTKFIINHGMILLSIALLIQCNMESQNDHTLNKQTSTDQEDVQQESINIRNLEGAALSKLAKPIERAHAYDMFMDYHGSNSSHPGNSEGCLTVNFDGRDSALTSVYLSIDSLINPLLNGVPTAPGETIIGLAGIPAYDNSKRSNTMIWVAVAERGDSIYYLLPPDSDASSEEYIYDYIDVCPDICPKNRYRLWQTDWKE